MNNNDAVHGFNLAAAIKDIELLKEHFSSLKSKVVGLPIDGRLFHVLIRQMAITASEIELIENDINKYCQPIVNLIVNDIEQYFKSATDNNCDLSKAETPFIKAPKKVSDIVSKYGHETQIWNKKDK